MASDLDSELQQALLAAGEQQGEEEEEVSSGQLGTTPAKLSAQVGPPALRWRPALGSGVH